MIKCTGNFTMKNTITFSNLTTLITGIALAGIYYSGPKDERMPPAENCYADSLGWLAQTMNVGAVADVIAVGPETTEYPFGSLMLHVVKAIYGCTNGQVLVVAKEDTTFKIDHPLYDPNWEYYPTNNSRIVFAGVTTNETRIGWSPFTAKDWKLPPELEVIHPSKDIPVIFYGVTRAWWYDGYQNNLPYMHLTNLVHAARVERNWTNYYHIIRDAVPTPAAPRVWEDSFGDIFELILQSTQWQYEYMANDSLFPAECKGIMDEIYRLKLSDSGFASDD